MPSPADAHPLCPLLTFLSADELEGGWQAHSCSLRGEGGRDGGQLTWAQFKSQLSELDPAEMGSSPGQHGCTWSLHPPAELETPTAARTKLSSSPSISSPFAFDSICQYRQTDPSLLRTGGLRGVQAAAPALLSPPAPPHIATLRFGNAVDPGSTSPAVLLR